MSWRAVGAVLRKELKETLRDRRTLMVMIVVPVLLYPMLMVIVEQVAVFGRRSMEQAELRVAVVGEPSPGHRLAELEGMTVLRPGAAPMEALRDGSLDAVLVYAEGPGGSAGTEEVRLLYDASRERSGYARTLLQQQLDAWRDSLVQQRLAASGLPAEFLSPLEVRSESIATPRQVGGYMLGRFLPLLLILMTVLGAFYPAIDLAAGEKERGTLEALLTVPVPADRIVVGKFIAAALLALTAASLNLGSMLLTFQSGLVRFGGVVDVQFQIPVRAILLIFAGLALLAVFFSSLFLGIAVRSHSFKEAQNALTPVYILSLIPAILPMMPGMEFGVGFAVVPIAGVGFLFRDLMGGSVEAAPAVTAIAATALYAALALVFAARAFGREDILFGTGGSTADLKQSGRAGRRGVPGPGVAFGLAALAAVLYFYLARPLVMRAGESGILASQWLFLALPAVLLVLIGRYSARETLALRRPTGRALGGAALLAAGGIPVGMLIGWLQGSVLELPVEFLEALRNFATADSPGRLLWLLLVIALTPAICEELVFRGVLLHGFGTRLPAWGSIAASALVFGAFHLSSETAIRFLPTLWLGLLFGYAVWRTRSIAVSMLMHLLNNASVVLLLAIPALGGRFADPSVPPPWLLLLAAPLLLGAGYRLLRPGS